MEQYHTKPQKGFLLLEALFSVALLGIIVIVLISGLVTGQQSSLELQKRSKAQLLLDESFAILYNIRDHDFQTLWNGTSSHGFILSNNTWALQSAPEILGSYTRTLNLTQDGNNVNVDITVSWNSGEHSISSSTTLSEWQNVFTQGNNILWDINGHTVVDLGDGRTTMQNIGITNTGPVPVTIDRIKAIWEKSGNAERWFEAIRIDNNTVWDYTSGTPSGIQLSPSDVDILDTTILPGETSVITGIDFSGNIMNHNISLTLVLKDGSEATVNFQTLPNYN